VSLSKQQVEWLDQKVREISEHFECVQVLVSAQEDESGDGGTFHIYSGAGNWFGRVGMARDFLTRDSANTHSSYFSNQPPPDDAESWKKS
jgi:hypothetical protein